MAYFSNTDWWEQYMLNKFPFSCSKNEAERSFLQINVYDKNKILLRPFMSFQKFVHENILNEIDDVKLRTEYDLASGGAVHISRWQAVRENRDLYPYMIYEASQNSCEICKALNGLVMPIEDIIATEYKTA